MGFLNHRKVGMVFYQISSSPLYSVQLMNCIIRKRLHEFEEIRKRLREFEVSRRNLRSKKTKGGE
jgi:hypothetical protein